MSRISRRKRDRQQLADSRRATAREPASGCPGQLKGRARNCGAGANVFMILPALDQGPGVVGERWMPCLHGASAPPHRPWPRRVRTRLDASAAKDEKRPDKSGPTTAMEEKRPDESGPTTAKDEKRPDKSGPATARKARESRCVAPTPTLTGAATGPCSDRKPRASGPLAGHSGSVCVR